MIPKYLLAVVIGLVALVLLFFAWIFRSRFLVKFSIIIGAAVVIIVVLMSEG